jgi:hypothetical protein
VACLTSDALAQLSFDHFRSNRVSLNRALARCFPQFLADDAAGRLTGICLSKAPEQPGYI